jgi:hypothetical protein
LAELDASYTYGSRAQPLTTVKGSAITQLGYDGLRRVVAGISPPGTRFKAALELLERLGPRPMNGTVPANASVDELFDWFEKHRTEMWEIIGLYQSGRDVRELEKILDERPHLTGHILYMMNELTSRRLLPIWRRAAAFTSSDNLDFVYYALSVIAYMLPHIDPEEARSYVEKVRVSEKSIDRKLQSINEALNARG